jgi:hypothetical protein
MVKPRCFKCKRILQNDKQNIQLNIEAREAIGIKNYNILNTQGNMEIVICGKCDVEWTGIYNKYMHELTWANRWAKFMGEKEVFIFR